MDLDIGLLGGIAEGIKGGMQGYNEGQDRKQKRLEMEAKRKSEETAQQRQRLMDEIALKDKGYEVQPGQDIYQGGLVREGGIFSPREQAEMRFKAGLDGQDVDFGEGGEPSLKYRSDYLAQKRKASAGDPIQEAIKLAQLRKLQSDADAKEKGRGSPVKGFKTTGDYAASSVEASKLRKGYADVQKFNSSLGSLESRVKNASKAELANPFSNTSKAIKNDLRDLQLMYKSPSFAELGVLTGPDLALLEEVIEDPGSLSNLYTGKDGVLARYGQLRDRVNTNLTTTLQSYGLEPEQTEQIVAPQNGLLEETKGLVKKGAGLILPEAQATSNKVRVSNGKETLLIDPSDLNDALKDGYRAVK